MSRRNSYIGQSIGSCIWIVFAAGCQSAQHSSPPLELSDRLAAIESSRLTTADRAASGDRFVDDDSWLAEDVQPVVRANEAPPRHEQRLLTRSQARRSLERPLMMSDFGSTASYEYDESDAYIHIPDASEREEKYARRPPLDSFWETVKRDIKRAPKDLWRDTKLVYANPVNLVILGSTYGGALAVRETGVDKGIERHFQPRRRDGGGTHHHIKKDWLAFFDAAGNPGTHFAMASIWYLIGQQSMDDKTYEVGKTLFSALMINGMTVIIGQAAHADRGPNGRYGTMPSGHTSSSFVLASVMHQAYGHLVGVPLYALATFNGWQRVDSREHYLSDVIMGGVLGLVVGHSVASGRDPEFFGWKIVPWASPDGGVGVAFAKPLD